MSDYASLETWINVVHAGSYELREYQALGLGTGVQTTDPKTAQQRAFAWLKNPANASSELDPSLVWWFGNFVRKFEYGCTATPTETITSFVARDDALSCSEPTLPWWVAARMKELLAHALSEFDFGLLIADGKFGPGAVAEGFNAIERWNVIEDFSYDARTMSLLRGGAWSKTGPARLCCVPKSYDSLRLISVEPVENSFGQQYVREALLATVHAGPLSGSVMDLTLTEWDHRGRPSGGANVHQQQARCIRASATGTLATIDLKDASDRISWTNVVSVFPAEVVAYLERFRTPCVCWRLPHRATVFKNLNMYAGMGNATTFIVETLYFWALMTTLGERFVGNCKPVTVFGDDIICDNRVARHILVQDCLNNRLGHIVNELKTCTSEGPGFRESCGVAAFRGKRLATLYRISGYDLQSDYDVQRLCGLANRAEHDVYSASSIEQRRLGAHVSWCLGPVRDHLYKMGVPWTKLAPTADCQLLYEAVPCLSCSHWGNDCAQMVSHSQDNPRGLFSPEADCWRLVPAECSRNPDLQISCVKAKVTSRKLRRIAREDLTLGEGLGVLRRQLTTMRTNPLKAVKPSKKTVLAVPTRDYETKHRWVTVM